MTIDVVCFGDSITRGESDAERGGWCDRLKTAGIARYQERGRDEECVFNLGIGGENTDSLRERFVSELKARFDADSDLFVLLAYGANDAAKVDGKPVVPLERYLENLAFCVEETRKLDGTPLLLTITPVAKSADGVVNKNGRLRSNATIRLYNDALRTAAAEQGVEILDAHAEFLKHDLEALFVPDGVHPNAKGHAVIFEAVKRRFGY
jgi:lysophospholipase L1-like esterase